MRKEHGISAYTTGRCRCNEICRPLWASTRARQRAEGRQTMSGSHTVPMGIDWSDTTRPVVILRQESHGLIVEQWLKDGADPETVGRRVGLSRRRVNLVLHAIQQTIGLDSREALAVAFLRGHAGWRVASSSPDEKSTLARRRIGA